jgi:hypothetical protein
MKTQSILVLALCTALGACDGSSTPSEGAAPPLPTRDLGDVVPRVLHTRDTPAVTKGLAQVSVPTAPERVLTPKQGTERITFRGALERVGADPSRTVIEIPVDTVGEETFLYIQPAAAGDALEGALADIEVVSPTGEPIDTADGAIELADHPTGVYQIRVGARAKPYGMTIELAQPDSPIALALETTAVVHFPGDSTRVDVALHDGNTPVNARVTAVLVSPDGSRTTPLRVQPIGAGTYHSLVESEIRLVDPTGMYSVYVTAEGTTASGVRFVKSGTVAVKYTIPTARITHVMPMRVVKRADNAIEAFEIDVKLEIASTDRYEVTGLVATTHKGVARRVCVAQTADVLEPGERSLTLRCEAGLVKLTRLQGNFHLEQLQLFSQGRAELLHRITTGLATIRTNKVSHAQLAELRERPPAVDEMIAQRLFDVE